MNVKKLKEQTIKNILSLPDIDGKDKTSFKKSIFIVVNLYKYNHYFLIYQTFMKKNIFIYKQLNYGITNSIL